MNGKPHIALVSTWFAPRQSVAVNRIEAFAAYLGKAGYIVTVISLSEIGPVNREITDFGYVYREPNPIFIKKLKFNTVEPRWKHLLKVAYNRLVNFIQPLPESGWMKMATQRLEKVHASTPINLVISSYGPIESHKAAFYFLKNHPTLPWIADMRDEMSLNNQLPSIVRKRLMQAEQEVGSRATAVTSVSKPILDQFKLLMPNAIHFEEVRNGFNHNIHPKSGFNPVFQIVYAGIFYGLRKPDTFFEGLQRALRQKHFEYEIVFVGTHSNFHIPAEILKHCRFIPRVSNSEAVHIMAQADANLLILPEVETKGVFSGKIFDQISVCKPIIAVVDPNDVAAELIIEMNAGYIADFNRPDEIAAAVLKTYAHWENRVPLDVNREQIAQLHRKHQVEKLVTLIQKILVP